jgi:ribosome-associated protein
MMWGMRDVQIRDTGIRLGQFLKLADVVDAGSDVKSLLASGRVRVNGELETRRGRQLVRADEVSVGDERYRVV